MPKSLVRFGYILTGEESPNQVLLYFWQVFFSLCLIQSGTSRVTLSTHVNRGLNYASSGGSEKGGMEMQVCSCFCSRLQLVTKFSAYGFSWNFLFVSSPPHLFNSHIGEHDFLSAGSTIPAQEQKIRLCSFSFRFHSHPGAFGGWARGGMRTSLVSVPGEQGMTKGTLLFHRHSSSELLNYPSPE